MIDLQTRYLGMTLKNPIVPSASPLSRDLDKCLEMEDAGASAIVMYSLFEEEIEQHEKVFENTLTDPALGFAEAEQFLPDLVAYSRVDEQYLEQLQKLKSRLDIPVVASLNGVGSGSWLKLAVALEEAGADAIELNLYNLATALDVSGQEVEAGYLEVVRNLRQQTRLPIVVKLSDQFSAPGHFIKLLEEEGILGVSLFNRFYQPDMDLDSGRPFPSLSLSSPDSYQRCLHWIALLHNRTQLSLCATGGIHDGESALKLVSAGADVVHMTSAILQQGPRVVTKALSWMTEWMDEQGFESLDDVKGRSAFWQINDKSAYERLNYYQNLRSFHY